MIICALLICVCLCVRSCKKKVYIHEEKIESIQSSEEVNEEIPVEKVIWVPERPKRKPKPEKPIENIIRPDMECIQCIAKRQNDLLFTREDLDDYATTLKR